MTHNIDTLVTRNTNLAALRTEIYTDDAHPGTTSLKILVGWSLCWYGGEKPFAHFARVKVRIPICDERKETSRRY